MSRGSAFSVLGADSGPEDDEYDEDESVAGVTRRLGAAETRRARESAPSLPQRVVLAPKPDVPSDRDVIFYFEMRGTEYLETAADADALPPPARTERLLAYATYRRRRCAAAKDRVVYTPKAFPGYTHRGRAYNAIVWGLMRTLEAERPTGDGDGEGVGDLLGPARGPPPRNLTMLNQLLPDEPDLEANSVASVTSPQLPHDSGERWRWELYDVDIQPPTWRYGHAEKGRFPFGLSALDVETLEWLENEADANAHDHRSNLGTPGERSWFGPMDDAIVVAIASNERRAATAVRLLRTNPAKVDGKVAEGAKDGGLAYDKDGFRSSTDNHDPVDQPMSHPDAEAGTDADTIVRSGRKVIDNHVERYDGDDARVARAEAYEAAREEAEAALASYTTGSD